MWNGRDGVHAEDRRRIPTDVHLRRLRADIRAAVAKQDEIDAGRPEKTATNDRLVFEALTAIVNRMLGEDEKETK